MEPRPQGYSWECRPEGQGLGLHIAFLTGVLRPHQGRVLGSDSWAVRGARGQCSDAGWFQPRSKRVSRRGHADCVQLGLHLTQNIPLGRAQLCRHPGPGCPCRELKPCPGIPEGEAWKAFPTSSHASEVRRAGGGQCRAEHRARPQGTRSGLPGARDGGATVSVISPGSRQAEQKDGSGWPTGTWELARLPGQGSAIPLSSPCG